MEKFIELKELRENIDVYISQVKQGKSFLVMRRSRPVFKISPPKDDNELWETVVDFTKMRRGGISLKEVLSRL